MASCVVHGFGNEKNQMQYNADFDNLKTLLYNYCLIRGLLSTVSEERWTRLRSVIISIKKLIIYTAVVIIEKL